MKKLNKFTKEELEKIYFWCNSWNNKKTKKIRYYLNTIKILEFFGNVFDFDSEDYEVFLNSKVWIENKEVFTDNKNKKILVKIESNLYKVLELKF